MTEVTFEKRLISILRADGWYACHVSRQGEGGFPDIMAYKSEGYRLIECKVWAGQNTIRELFQPTQPAFYAVHSDELEELYVAILEGKYVWVLQMDRTLAKDMMPMTVSDFLKRANAYLLTPEAAVKWITSGHHISEDVSTRDFYAAGGCDYE